MRTVNMSDKLWDEWQAQAATLERVRDVMAKAEARVAEFPGLKGSTYYAAYLENLAILAEAEESQPRTAAPTPNPVTRYNTELEEKHAALMARNADLSQQLLRAEHELGEKAETERLLRIQLGRSNEALRRVETHAAQRTLARVREVFYSSAGTEAIRAALEKEDDLPPAPPGGKLPP